MNKDRLHQIFDKLSLYVILASVVTFTLETHPAMKTYAHELRVLDTIFVIIFCIDYLVRLMQNEHKLKFVFSFFGLVDLLAILPFFLSFGVADLRWVRVLRVLRVFRIFKLARYIKAMDRIIMAIRHIQEELIVFTCVSLLVVYLSSVGIYYFEHAAQPQEFKSILHSLWWAIVTLTTLGYGDVYPVTTGGKVFTGIILIIGLGLISIPSGLLASSFTHVFRHDEDKTGK